MGILSALRRMVSGPKAQSYDLTNMSNADIQEFLRIGGGLSTASGVNVNDSAAMRVAAAWRCVQIISGAMGTLPLDLIRREDERTRTPARGHPLRRVLTVKPNHWQTPSEFRRLLQSHLLLRGNAFAIKAMAGGQVRALIPIHPDRVSVEQQPDLSMLYRVTRKTGQPETYTQKEILHLRGMSLDGVQGLSVLAHMRETLGLAIKSEQSAATLMKNGSFASGVLQHPGKLSDDAVRRLREFWRNQTTGDNAGGTAVLEEGLKYEPIGMTANDAQFLQNRDFQRYDIAMFFGVPPHMIGATEKTTSWGSGIEQQGIGFVTYTLTDWMRSWEEALKRDLLPESEWETLDFRYYPQGLLRGDSKARWETYTKALQWGVYSPDEVRAYEDENPRPDGEGGIYYDPPNTSGNSEGEGNEPPQAA